MSDGAYRDDTPAVSTPPSDVPRPEPVEPDPDGFRNAASEEELRSLAEEDATSISAVTGSRETWARANDRAMAYNVPQDEAIEIAKVEIDRIEEVKQRRRRNKELLEQEQRQQRQVATDGGIGPFSRTQVELLLLLGGGLLLGWLLFGGGGANE